MDLFPLKQFERNYFFKININTVLIFKKKSVCPKLHFKMTHHPNFISWKMVQAALFVWVMVVWKYFKHLFFYFPSFISLRKAWSSVQGGALSGSQLVTFLALFWPPKSQNSGQKLDLAIPILEYPNPISTSHFESLWYGPVQHLVEGATWTDVNFEGPVIP